MWSLIKNLTDNQAPQFHNLYQHIPQPVKIITCSTFKIITILIFWLCYTADLTTDLATAAQTWQRWLLSAQSPVVWSASSKAFCWAEARALPLYKQRRAAEQFWPLHRHRRRELYRIKFPANQKTLVLLSPVTVQPAPSQQASTWHSLLFMFSTALCISQADASQ